MQRIRNNAAQVAKITLLAAVGTFLAWRIVVLNMGDQFAQGFDEPDIIATLKWDSSQPSALYLDAIRQVAKRPEEARREFEAAIRANPSDGVAYAALGDLLETQGEIEAASRAMKVAATMAPQRTEVQSEVAAFWTRRGDMTQALEHWNVVLTFDSEMQRKLFPALLQLAEDPAGRAAFEPLLQKPVKWWPDFFRYAAANSIRLQTARDLYAMQAKGPNDPTPESLKAYLDRLQREGYWTESYFVWLNGLSSDQLQYVGNLNNGSFELPISSVGFDWISWPAGYVLVEAAPTFGTVGSKALHVVFRGPRVKYEHLGQYMLLPPGDYTLRGRVRPDDLKTQPEGGPQWAVYCIAPEWQPLGHSETFTGTDQWQRFSFQFTIPEKDCPVQVARLELAGRVPLDFEVKGGIWFDDLAVDRQSLD
jgi:hypothetical protein